LLLEGRRPSETAIPKSGSFPQADLPNTARLMGVQGPLARSALDLELLFDVLVGPEPGEEVGRTLALPPARHQCLADFRVALLPPPLGVQASASMRSRLEELAHFLSRAGATVAEAAPGFDFKAYYYDYLRLLNVMTTIGMPRLSRGTSRYLALGGWAPGPGTPAGGSERHRAGTARSRRCGH
jgi:amidase